MVVRYQMVLGRKPSSYSLVHLIALDTSAVCRVEGTGRGGSTREPRYENLVILTSRFRECGNYLQFSTIKNSG